MNNFIFLKLVDLYDDKVFTKQRSIDWKKHIIRSYESIYNIFKSKIKGYSNIGFFLDKDLLNEVIIDAIVGMRKITDSKYTSVEDPNAFKIISYLTYWWLRHKPISIHFNRGFSLKKIEIKGEFANDEEKEYARQKLIWDLKHINEIVAVQISLTYIFDFSTQICDDKICDKLKKIENENFCFKNFEEMKDVIIQKLTYYFAYRALAPKMIEHLLEGYTLHPAWSLTGPQWSVAQTDAVAP